MYDIKTGQKQTRGGRPIPRPAGTPTPCHQCPKGSPEEAKDRELSDKNARAWWYYRQARAPLGQQLPADAIVHRNHAIIDQVVRDAEEYRAAMPALALAGASVSRAMGGAGGR